MYIRPQLTRVLLDTCFIHGLKTNKAFFSFRKTNAFSERPTCRKTGSQMSNPVLIPVLSKARTSSFTPLGQFANPLSSSTEECVTKNQNSNAFCYNKSPSHLRLGRTCDSNLLSGKSFILHGTCKPPPRSPNSYPAGNRPGPWSWQLCLLMWHLSGPITPRALPTDQSFQMAINSFTFYLHIARNA